MTNKEKYKEAFSSINISDDINLEVNEMERKHKHKKLNKLITSVAASLIVIFSTSVAYATDLGNIQRSLQLWLNGEQTHVSIEFDGNGNYQLDYVDADGMNHSQNGGGISIDFWGNEHPLTEEELMESLNAPNIIYSEDGSVWIYWYNQKVDITNKFEDGICYIKLVNGEESIYITAKYQRGWSSSPHKFLAP